MTNLAVIDASVILNWVVPPEAQPYQSHVLSLAGALAQGQIKVRLPSRWYFEVGNIAMTPTAIWPTANNSWAHVNNRFLRFISGRSSD